MSTYYLAASPETIVSILSQQSSSQNNLRRGVFKTSTEALAALKDTRVHQIFLLEFDFQETDMGKNLVIPDIKRENLKRVILFSKRAEKLFKNMITDHVNLNILIEPILFMTEAELSFLTEETSLQPSSFNKAQDAFNNFDDCMMGRISSYEEHLDLLKTVFLKAKKSILITSFNISEKTFEKADLYQLIPQAITRGVKIYIYYNDQKEENFPIQIKQFLNQFPGKIFLHFAYTHSKILAADHCFIAVGSCNWLSIFNKNYSESAEGSLVFTGRDLCADVCEDCWNHLKYYRNLQFGNKFAVNRFNQKEENLSTVVYGLDENLELEYLPTLEQNLFFLRDVFEKAKERIIVCSPFISSCGAYEQDLTIELLKKTVDRGVDVFFVCLENIPSLKYFDAFLAEINSAKIRLLPMSRIHLKTIIVDNDGIAEGSFNWLSASRQEESDYHNHEQTFYIRGQGAQGFILDFFNSRFGLELKKIMKEPLGAMYKRAVSDPIPPESRPKPRNSHPVFRTDIQREQGNHYFSTGFFQGNVHQQLREGRANPSPLFFNNHQIGNGNAFHQNHLNNSLMQRGNGRGASYNKGRNPRGFYPYP